MELRSDERSFIGMEASDVINLWFDEYYLFKKYTAVKENVQDSKLDVLLDAHLNKRTLPHNEYSILIGWLNMLSDPLRFVNVRGSVHGPVPLLKCALDRKRVVQRIMEIYSEQKQSPHLSKAFDELKKNLEAAMLAVCCNGQYFNVGLEIIKDLHQESGLDAQISSKLRDNLKERIDYDPSKELEVLRRSTKGMMVELYKHMPKPSLLSMAEALVTRGHMYESSECSSVEQTNCDADNDDFDIPRFKVKYMPKELTKDRELRVREWAEKLTNERTMLRERLKNLKVAGKLQEIPSTSKEKVPENSSSCNVASEREGYPREKRNSKNPNNGTSNKEERIFQKQTNEVEERSNRSDEIAEADYPPPKTSTQEEVDSDERHVPSPCFSQDSTLTPIKMASPLDMLQNVEETKIINPDPQIEAICQVTSDVLPIKNVKSGKRAHKLLFSEKNLDKTLDVTIAESVATPGQQNFLLRQLRNNDKKITKTFDKIDIKDEVGIPGAESNHDTYDSEFLAFSKSSKTSKNKRKRKRWSEEETGLLVEAVNKMGLGKWREIQKKYFSNRSNIDLKDRWRSMHKRN